MRFVRPDDEEAVLPASVLAAYTMSMFPQFSEAFRGGLKLEAPTAFDLVPGANNVAYPVALPVADLAYGYYSYGSLYNKFPAFTEAQCTAGEKMDPPMGRVNEWGLAFPFFVVKYGIKYSTKVAESECMGATATAVAVVERLNRLLLQKCPKAQTVCNAAFSIAVGEGSARLWITWRGDEKVYYMRRVATFDMDVDLGLREMSLCVKKIIAWGKGACLQEIQQALEAISGADSKDRLLAK
ncbi:hypothetical protein PG984_007528 [Apiospora sp. TS-2023a]